jgi:hypothetical protein
MFVHGQYLRSGSEGSEGEMEVDLRWGQCGIGPSVGYECGRRSWMDHGLGGGLHWLMPYRIQGYFVSIMGRALYVCMFV